MTPQASASPLSSTRQQAADAKARVSQMNSVVAETVRKYDTARGELSAVQSDLAANSAKLNDLVQRQTDLQKQLDIRAQGMYRSGPLGYVEVLARTASFEEFSTTWFMLTRIGRHDAITVAELKRTRAEVARSADDLMSRQADVSRKLRALEAAKADAKTSLAKSQASYVSYTKQIADLEAKQAAEQRSRVALPKIVRAPKPYNGPRGSGEWSSAVASCYGTDDIGSPTADGGHVEADSMIVAHKTLPFGTMIEFEYGGHTAVARVADRGPYIDGREFDLGPGLARVLGFDGVDTVRYRIIGG